MRCNNQQSGNYLLEIINDLLDLSKIESGKVTLQKEPVSLPVLRNEIHSLLSVRAKKRSCDFRSAMTGLFPKRLSAIEYGCGRF